MTSRIIPILCIAMLAISSASAAYYVTIVDDNAPVTDVINAANFAASMKASVGVSFTGVLASEADAKIAVRSDPVMQVWFDGGSVEIIAEQDEFSTVIPTVRQYLVNEGFDVEFTTLGKVLAKEQNVCCAAMTASCLACSLGLSVEEYCKLYSDTAECPNPCAAVLCPVDSICEVQEGQGVCVVQEIDQSVEEPVIVVPEPAPLVEPEQESQPNVLARFWRWVTGLFS